MGKGGAFPSPGRRDPDGDRDVEESAAASAGISLTLNLLTVRRRKSLELADIFLFSRWVDSRDVGRKVCAPRLPLAKETSLVSV